MQINLTNTSQKALIDDKYILLSIYSWRLKSDGRGMYYVALTRHFGKRFKTVYLHKLIYLLTYNSIPKKMDIHHKDFNPLNCQDGNLEIKARGTHSSTTMV